MKIATVSFRFSRDCCQLFRLALRQWRRSLACIAWMYRSAAVIELLLLESGNGLHLAFGLWWAFFYLHCCCQNVRGLWTDRIVRWQRCDIRFLTYLDGSQITIRTCLWVSYSSHKTDVRRKHVFNRTVNVTKSIPTSSGSQPYAYLAPKRLVANICGTVWLRLEKRFILKQIILSVYLRETNQPRF